MTNETDFASTMKTRRKYWLTLLSIFFICVLFVWLIYWFFSGQYYVSTDDAYVNGNLVQVMSRIPGHVTQILADETELVVKGQPLVVLDKANATIALENAKAQLALTSRQVSQLYQNVDQLQANVKVAQSAYDQAKEDYLRRKGLNVKLAISVEDLRHAQLAEQATADALEQAKHQLASATNLVQNVDLYHHPEILQSMVNFQNAYLTWKRTTIYAPDTGYVAKRNVQLGEHVTANSVLMIVVPLNQIWVDANFKESQIKYIRIGQKATLVSDVYGRSITYHGIVVGLNPGAGNTFDLLPPQNATGNWIKITQRLPVRIAINKKELKKYPLRIGLSMRVTIDTHRRDGDVLARAPHFRVVYSTNDESAYLTEANQSIGAILKSNAENTNLPTTK